MSKSSFNFTEAIKRLIEMKEMSINQLIDEFLQNVIKSVVEQDMMLSKEMVTEIFFIQTDTTFEQYYEEFSVGDEYEKVNPEYDDPIGDVIFVGLKNIYEPEDGESPFIELYSEEFDSVMETSIILNEIRKKMISEELKTTDYYCIGALENGKSFSVKFED